jgi:Family of unknown function (DUF6092)
MNEQDLRRDLFLLVGYLLTSAHGLCEEPAGYGPFRLLDAAGRVLAVIEAHGLVDPYLAGLKAEVDGERYGTSTDEALCTRLDQLCRQYAAELKARTP